jgi:tripartite motif-containing protein 37
MFSAEHKGHEFKHLNSVYNQHLQEINSESKVLVKRINELEAVLDSLDVNIEKIKAVKSEKSREMTQCFEQMVNRLDEQLRVKTFELGKKREMICDEIKKMKSLQTDVDKELALVSKNKLIVKSNDLVRKLQEFKEVDVNKFDVQQFSCEFKSEVVPQYVSGVFELKEFSKAQGTVEVVYSEVLDYNGLLWRLKVYPNGNGVAKGTYLSVFLELLKGYGDSAKYDYRVEMVNHQDLAQQVIREFASEFETGECWGYNRFFKISLLKDEGYLTDSDTLVMKFYVRAPSYFQLYKDQKNYIKYLQDKENSYKSKLAEFMEKIEEFGDNRMMEDGKNEEVSKEYTPNPPHELSTVMQKYLMSPPDDDSSDELTPVNIDWTQIQDMPDFNNYSDLTGNDPESPENQEVQSQEFWPLE